jgi:hypothetical protein
MYKLETHYQTLIGKCHFGGACHARMLLSGIHLMKIKEIPTKNMRPKEVPVVRE